MLRAHEWTLVSVRAGVVGLFLGALLGSVAMAGPFEDAGSAHVRGDYASEFKLLAPLAAAGNPDAQYNLGVLYNKGLGVPKNYTAALQWYRKAVSQGNALARLSLGVMYATGQGVRQDYLQARVWFILAVEGIPESDATHHATAVDYRDRVAAHLSAAQIAEAKKRSREWRPD